MHTIENPLELRHNPIHGYTVSKPELRRQKLVSLEYALKMQEALEWARGFGKNGHVHDKMIMEKIEKALTQK